MSTEYIHYAECTKFTPGQLDMHPWSTYAIREVAVDVDRVPADAWLGPEWKVSRNGVILAVGEDLNDALGLAAYELMDASREKAKAEAEQTMKGTE